MGSKLYVGNLAYSLNDESLKEHFDAYGTVVSCKVITDRDSGRSKGFAFVEMSTDEEAQAAIANLDNKDIAGRPLRVNEARPPKRKFSDRRGNNRQ